MSTAHKMIKTWSRCNMCRGCTRAGRDWVVATEGMMEPFDIPASSQEPDTHSKPDESNWVVVLLCAVHLAGVALLLALYVMLHNLGIDIGHSMAGIVAGVLLLTCLIQVFEVICAQRMPAAPASPARWYPPASAILIASQPLDLAAIRSLVSRLRSEYPESLQVVVVCLQMLSPQDHQAVWHTVREDGNMIVLDLGPDASPEGALTSAIEVCDGEFIGIYHTHHRGPQDMFSRAWIWLSQGFHGVRGTAQSGNANKSWVARADAIEGSSPGYAWSSSNRVRENAFWPREVAVAVCHGQKTDVLPVLWRQCCIDADLDSSRRSPVTLPELLRERRAVARRTPLSLKQTMRTLRSRITPAYVKLHAVNTNLWFPARVWLSLQVFPLIAYFLWRDGIHITAGLSSWFVLLTLFVLQAGPLQAVLAYNQAPETLRHRNRTLVLYGLSSSLVLTELNGMIERLAQLESIVFGARPNRSRLLAVDRFQPMSRQWPPLPANLEGVDVFEGLGLEQRPKKTSVSR